MFSRLIVRLIDWLVAILIVCALLWFFITQPILPIKAVDDLPQVNTANLKNHVINFQKIVASQQLMKESLSTDNYIFTYFERIGKPTKQGFVGMSGRYNNVSLLIGPSTEQRIVIGVQYSPPKGETKHHWNSSGVATLLEAARVLGANKDKLPVAVELVAYATAGMAANGTLDMGSFHHAKYLKDQKVDLQLMLALRSVGYYRNEANSQRYPFSFMRMLYPDSGDFISLSSRFDDFGIVRAVKHSFSKIPELSVESLNGPENFPLIGGSDHENYWVQDFAALQISDLLEYRMPKDQINNYETPLDYEKMARVVQALYQTALDSEATGSQSGENLFSKYVEKITAIFK